MKHWCLLAVVTILASTAGIRAQHSTQPAFRAEVNLVRLTVRALDDQDRPVSDLSALDFTVREDRRLQDIATFETVDRAPNGQ